MGASLAASSFVHLLRGEGPADGAEVGLQLLLVARTDDDGGDGGTAQEPVESDLRDRLAGLLGDHVDGVDDLVEIFIRHLGAGKSGLMKAALCRDGLVAANLAGKAAPAEGRPDEGSDALIDGERHQLPLVVASDERVVDLVANVFGPAVALRDGERLHQVPAGEVAGRRCNGPYRRARGG